jgi:hypothetical protein
MRKAIAAVLGGAALLAVGCGDSGSYANDPRPPAPLTVTASVTSKRLTVAPQRIGAGPITLIVANLTNASQDVTIKALSAAGGGPPEASTGPINPQGTAELKYDAAPGDYQVTADHGPAPAVLRVGKLRASAQDELLLP